MAIPKSHRFATMAGEATFQQINKIVETYDVSQAGLLEVLLLGLEAQGADLGPIIETGKQRRKEVNPDRRKQRTDLIAQLSKLPKDRLEAMLAEAAANGEEPAAP